MRIKNNPDIKVGKKLQSARMACGYTQEEVAEILNCSSRYIGQLETNKSFGSISLMIDLCNIYNITLNDIYADFINTENVTNNSSIIGYNALKDEYKQIIDNNIQYMNSLQNKK